MKYIYLFLCYFLGFTFIYTGIQKYIHFDNFMNSLFNYSVIPKEFVYYISYPIIFMEIWLGLGMLFQKSRNYSLYGLILLLFIFTILIAYEYLSGNNFSCGCGLLFSNDKINLIHIMQNLFLIFIIIIIFFNNKRYVSQIS